MSVKLEGMPENIATADTFTGKASIVTDEKLNQKLSQLKYPGEQRANEKRVAIEVTLDHNIK